MLLDSGTDLCSTIFGGAFIVNNSLSSTSQYTMGWVDGFDNPNDDASASNGLTITTNSAGQEKCGLHYYHRDYTIEQQPGEYNLCHNYREKSCCNSSTVASFDAINEIYGAKFHIDRCGPISNACQQFFIMESCLYECDPNAGLFRKYNDSQVAADVAKYGQENLTNTWQMYGMPIKQSFCDQWYEACYNDLFCGADDGNFFSCAKIYEAALTPEQQQLANEQAMNDGLIALTVILTIFGFCLICTLIYLVYRERTGKAVFMPLMEGETPDGKPMQNMSIHKNPSSTDV